MGDLAALAQINLPQFANSKLRRHNPERGRKARFGDEVH